MNDIVVMLGSEIKMNKDGQIEGYLVRFGSETQTDLENDYFTPDTDFGREIGEKSPLNLYYHHGLDPVIGKRYVGKGFISRTPEGIWYEGQLEMRDEYDKMIAKLAKEGKLGFSSGAASHLVERKMSGNAYEITRWALAEASITPRPAEPRAWASAKSLDDLKMDTKPYYDEEGRWHPKKPYEKEMEDDYKDGEEEIVIASDYQELLLAVYGDANEELVMGSIEKLYSMMVKGIYSLLENNAPIEQIDAVVNGFHEKVVGIINKINSEEMSEGMDTLKSIFEPSKPSDIRDVERRLRDAFGLSRKEATKKASTVWDALCDKEEPAEIIEDSQENNADTIKTLLAKVMLDLI